ncbi:hypothetical protein [Neobacillus ginsengisoli]|uniref:Uncharacterized protein n=1 Tax=Neobacillus ginsengisoli TaxID=904295 RepID=A0ABT9Y206_9BACI|nr:hypothetical protein [Neobacillus ginsengisoli]MDQ0201861.1 hypothetical protein [Neobacillus ginsengisoli]
MRILSTIFCIDASNYKNAIDSILDSYNHVLKERDGTLVRMYSDLPEYNKLKDELISVGVEVEERRRVEFSKKEFDLAPLLALYPTYQDLNPYSEVPDTYFSSSCNQCNAYINQTNDLMIRRNSVGSRDFIMSWEAELLVSPKVKRLFDANSVTGISYRPVYTKKNIQEIAYQLVPLNELPPLQTMLNPAIDCSNCGFKSFGKAMDSVLCYGVEAWDNYKDLNYTSEYFGEGYFPRRKIIISQRVRQILISSKVRGIRYEPVCIKN